MMCLTLAALVVCMIAIPAQAGLYRPPPGYYADWYNRYYAGRGRSPGLGSPGAPGQGTPGQGMPGQGTPGQGTPGQRTPGQGTPRQGTPGQAGTGGAGERLPAPEVYVNPQDAVAFSAVETTDQFFYKAGPLVFDDVLTNIGGGYNSEYGVFTAPVPGIYSVNYHATSNPNSPKSVHVDLLWNRRVVNSAKGSGVSGTPSNSAVLYLDQFDTLNVNGRAGTAVGCGSNSRFCTFNVVLIKMGKFTDQKITRAFPMDNW